MGNNKCLLFVHSTVQLKSVRVRNYKCIEDSGEVEFERVTCFVGKNESGKTAFLEAIRKLNPVNSVGEYDPLREYPRRRYTDYKDRHQKEPDPVVTATYGLSNDDLDAIELEYGEGIISGSEVQVTKNYADDYLWEVPIKEGVFISQLVSEYSLPGPTERSIEDIDTIRELKEKLESSDAESEEAPEFKQRIQNISIDKLANKIGNDVLINRQPKFLYFDDYSIMDGDVHIKKLSNRKKENESSDADKTFMALLSLANLDLDEIRTTKEYEEITAELEAASNHISNEVFDYWTQGPDLRVEFDVSEEYPNPNGRTKNQTKSPMVHIRIKNKRHQVTLPFDERSRGFVWFFSFMAYFSGVAEDDDNFIFLLDEPGLNLHAKAQHDFVRFINDRLAPKHPVVYTTHSPFMLEPKRLDRARLVIDRAKSEDNGTIISDNILQSDNDTVFPLQAALGYDLIQTLLLGPECLLVEGKSDMVFLQVMSDILDQKERTPLSHRWTIVPVNGADNVPTFVSLFGASNLEVGVLLDDDSRISQRLEEIEERRILKKENIKTVGNYVESGEGDTEDMFSDEFYLELVQGAYYRELSYDTEVPDKIDLNRIELRHPRITKRVERFFEKFEVNKGRFSHHKPATHFQRHRLDHIESLDDTTLDRFESLFKDLNGLLS